MQCSFLVAWDPLGLMTFDAAKSFVPSFWKHAIGLMLRNGGILFPT